jgi:hypothetical protein
MSTIASIFAVLIVVLILLVIGNLVFSFIAERRNPPVGKFIECDGVRVHYREWGDAAEPPITVRKESEPPRVPRVLYPSPTKWRMTWIANM